MEKYKRIELKCSKCGKPIEAKGELWLTNDALLIQKEQRYICSHCIAKWKKDYEVLDCEFEVTDIDTTANVRCRKGNFSVSTQALRQTPENHTLNVPQEFIDDVLSRLANFRANRSKILEEQQKQNLKYVDFLDDEWQGHYFNCETRNGDKYENIVFKLDDQKRITLKPGQDVPKLVLDFVQQDLYRRLGK